MENNVNITLDYYEKLKDDSLKLNQYEQGGLIVQYNNSWEHSSYNVFAKDESKVSEHLKSILNDLNKNHHSKKIDELEHKLFAANHKLEMSNLSFKQIKSKWWFKLFKNF